MAGAMTVGSWPSAIGYWLFAAAAAAAADYAVVLSETTARDPAWAAVAAALQAKHGGERITWSGSVTNALPALRAALPRRACFVTRPEEATREYVARVHQLTRALDDDPWGDCLWGILTGFDASNALAIARTAAPLTVRKGAGGTAIALGRMEEGVWYDEGRRGHAVEKRRGGEPRDVEAPGDTTKTLVDLLNGGTVDLLVTSGHATERDWQIGYSYRNGQFRSKAGGMRGVDTFGGETEVRSANPKVYLPVGNCLMGHIDGPDAMALAWMNAAGVRQMIGYTVPTWFGYMGWGVLDYFVDQPGRFTLAEAFFANQQALIAELQRNPSSKGHRFDRDVVAFYGDPGWEARMAQGPRNWEQSLDRTGDRFTFTVRPNLGAASFGVADGNGSQRGGRPFVHLLPVRIGPAKVIEGAGLSPLIADDFLLVPHPGACDTNRTYRIAFDAPLR
jgi:zinc protease